MKKITICHFILGFHNGGVEKVLENYFSHMDKSEFELHIVTHIEPDLKRQNIFENMGFQIHQLSRVHGSRITAQNIKEYKKLFESYKITVCSEIRSYTDTGRAQAPQDSNQYFGVEG